MKCVKLFVISLVLCFAGSVSATESFVLSLSETSLSIDQGKKDSLPLIYGGKSDSIQKRAEYLSKMPSDMYDVEAASFMQKESDKPFNVQEYRQLIEAHIIKTLKNYEHTILAIQNGRAIQVHQGRTFVVDLLTKGSAQEVMAARIFVNKYFRLPFKVGALQEVYNLLSLVYDHVMYVSLKDYNKKEITAIQRFAESLNLRTRKIGHYLLAGSGITFNVMEDVFNQGKSLRSERLKRNLKRVQEAAKNRKAIFISKYLHGARAYFSNSSERKVSFVIPEQADLNLHVHEVTHYRFYNFETKYNKWIKAKGWVTPYQVNDATLQFWSLLNEINSWRLGTEFEKPMSDKEILEVLKKHYAQKSDTSYYRAFFEFWTPEKLKGRSIPSLILEETRKLNTMSEPEFIRYAEHALVEKNEVALRNSIALIENKSLRLSSTSAHEHIINKYINAGVLTFRNEYSRFSILHKSFQYKLDQLEYNTHLKPARLAHRSISYQQAQDYADVFFSDSKKGVKDLMRNVFTGKYKSKHEVMRQAEANYGISNLSSLELFLKKVEEYFPNDRLAVQLEKFLMNIKLLSYEDFKVYFEVNPSFHMLITNLLDENNRLTESKVIHALSMLLDPKLHKEKRKNLFFRFNLFLQEKGLKDLRTFFNDHNSTEVTDISINSQKINSTYFTSKLNRFLSLNLFEVFSHSQVDVLTSFIKIYSKPHMLPKLMAMMSMDIDLFRNDTSIPYWFYSMMDPVTDDPKHDKKVNLSWGHFIIDTILSHKDKLTNPEMLILITNFYRYQLGFFLVDMDVHQPKDFKFGEQEKLIIQEQIKENKVFEYWMNRVAQDLWPLLKHENKQVRRAALYTIASNPAYLYMMEDKIKEVKHSAHSNRLMRSQVKQLLSFTQEGFFNTPLSQKARANSCELLFSAM